MSIALYYITELSPVTKKSKQQYIDAIIRLSKHYPPLDKQTEYELIGGEVTVITALKT